MSEEPSDLVTEALDAAARAAVPDDRRAPRWQPPLEPAGRARWAARSRRFVPLLAAAAVLVLAAGTTATVSVLRSGHHAPVAPPPTTVSTTPAPARPAPSSPTPSSPAPSPTATSTHPTQTDTSRPPATAAFQLGYQPLWPFADRATAAEWEQADRTGGHQPWHVDPAQTALSFTTGYLGFAGIDTVTSTAMGSDGAHIGVGYRDPNGAAHTAAVLHLVRFGPTAAAPWEVVGSDDTTFSLELPAYGSRVSSPLTAGGHVTGVDESIRVSVRQLSSAAPIGQTCCTPGGGTNSPWRVSVSFAGAADAVLTVAASTGGHLSLVERFAIQAVRTR